VNGLEAEAPFRYLRFREPPYDEGGLEAAAAQVKGLLDGGLEVFAYFQHEDEATAPVYADRLRTLVSQL
jgi:hypothetical protein